MIEHLKIITGSRKEVTAKAQAYLSEHPNATVLGTAISHKRGELIEQADPEPAKKKAATKQAANAPAEAAPEPVAATLRSVEYGPDVEVISITLGRVFA